MLFDPEYLYRFTVYMLIIVLAGAFGGYVSALFDNLTLPGDTHKNDKCAKCDHKYFFCRSMIGICGAFGVVLIGGSIGKVQLELDVESVIKLISLCVISGIVSFRLLPVIGHKLQKQIDALEATTENQNQKIKNLKEISHNELQRESLIQDALSMAKDIFTSKKDSSAEIYTAISLMEKLRGAAKYQRSFNIYLGRLYRRVKNYDAAIKVLREYINTIESDPLLPPELKELVPVNKAAALYNIACYHALKAEIARETSAVAEIDRLLGSALQELAAALSLDPSNWVQAGSPAENDFDIFRDSPVWEERFCAIIQAAKESLELQVKSLDCSGQ